MENGESQIKTRSGRSYGVGATGEGQTSEPRKKDSGVGECSKQDDGMHSEATQQRRVDGDGGERHTGHAGRSVRVLSCPDEPSGVDCNGNPMEAEGGEGVARGSPERDAEASTRDPPMDTEGEGEVGEQYRGEYGEEKGFELSVPRPCTCTQDPKSTVWDCKCDCDTCRCPPNERYCIARNGKQVDCTLLHWQDGESYSQFVIDYDFSNPTGDIWNSWEVSGDAPKGVKEGIATHTIRRKPFNFYPGDYDPVPCQICRAIPCTVHEMETNEDEFYDSGEEGDGEEDSSSESGSLQHAFREETTSVESVGLELDLPKDTWESFVGRIVATSEPCMVDILRSEMYRDTCQDYEVYSTILVAGPLTWIPGEQLVKFARVTMSCSLPPLHFYQFLKRKFDLDNSEVYGALSSSLVKAKTNSNGEEIELTDNQKAFVAYLLPERGALRQIIDDRSKIMKVIHHKTCNSVFSCFNQRGLVYSDVQKKNMNMVITPLTSTLSPYIGDEANAPPALIEKMPYYTASNLFAVEVDSAVHSPRAIRWNSVDKLVTDWFEYRHDTLKDMADKDRDEYVLSCGVNPISAQFLQELLTHNDNHPLRNIVSHHRAPTVDMDKYSSIAGANSAYIVMTDKLGECKFWIASRFQVTSRGMSAVSVDGCGLFPCTEDLCIDVSGPRFVLHNGFVTDGVSKYSIESIGIKHPGWKVSFELSLPMGYTDEVGYMKLCKNRYVVLDSEDNWSPVIFPATIAKLEGRGFKCGRMYWNTTYVRPLAIGKRSPNLEIDLPYFSPGSPAAYPESQVLTFMKMSEMKGCREILQALEFYIHEKVRGMFLAQQITVDQYKEAYLIPPHPDLVGEERLLTPTQEDFSEYKAYWDHFCELIRSLEATKRFGGNILMYHDRLQVIVVGRAESLFFCDYRYVGTIGTRRTLCGE